MAFVSSTRSVHVSEVHNRSQMVWSKPESALAIGHKPDGEITHIKSVYPVLLDHLIIMTGMKCISL